MEMVTEKLADGLEIEGETRGGQREMTWTELM